MPVLWLSVELYMYIVFTLQWNRHAWAVAWQVLRYTVSFLQSKAELWDLFFFFQSKFGKSVNCIYLFKSFCLYSIEYIQPQINVQFPSEDQQPQKISRQKSF